ncbi:MAG: DUF3617 domain-containing protein [Methylobacillus sp.]|jgi:hypothetical protein|nr:DUF3617 domain-containing protein [Methylobacillus sp.]
MKAVLLGLYAILVTGAAQAQTIAGPVLKPGLWEMNIIKMEKDGKDIRKDMLAEGKAEVEQELAKMPPEQRKKIEDSIAQGRLDLTGRNQCWGPESGKNYFSQTVFSMSQLPECTQPKIVDRSGDRTTYEMSCKNKTGTLKSQVIATDDLVTTKMETVNIMGKDGAQHTFVSELQLKSLTAEASRRKSR